MNDDVIAPGGTFLGIHGGFAVVLVRKGDKYGRGNCLTHGEDVPLVEFYDVAAAGKRGFTKAGQFVSRYYATTLRDTRGQGLCLDAGVPQWRIAAAPLADAIASVEMALNF